MSQSFTLNVSEQKKIAFEARGSVLVDDNSSSVPLRLHSKSSVMSAHSHALNDNLKERLTYSTSMNVQRVTVDNIKLLQVKNKLSQESLRYENSDLFKLTDLLSTIQSEMDQLQEMLNLSPTMIKTECYLVQLLHLTNLLIEGIHQENANNGGENANLPINAAMKVYVQLKYLIKQLPEVARMQPHGSNTEFANVTILTQQLLDITLGRLMEASTSGFSQLQSDNQSNNSSPLPVAPIAGRKHLTAK